MKFKDMLTNIRYISFNTSACVILVQNHLKQTKIETSLELFKQILNVLVEAVN